MTYRPNQIRALALGGPKLKNLVRADRLGRSGDWLRRRETRFGAGLNLVSAVPGAYVLPVTRRPNQVQEFALSDRKHSNLVRADRPRRSGDRLPWRETRFDTSANWSQLSTSKTVSDAFA
jgi:hypothetical protein